MSNGSGHDMLAILLGFRHGTQIEFGRKWTACGQERRIKRNDILLEVADSVLQDVPQVLHDGLGSGNII